MTTPRVYTARGAFLDFPENELLILLSDHKEVVKVLRQELTAEQSEHTNAISEVSRLQAELAEAKAKLSEQEEAIIEIDDICRHAYGNAPYGHKLTEKVVTEVVKKHKTKTATQGANDGDNGN